MCRTDRRTDGRTDGHTETGWRHIPRLCIASRGKKTHQSAREISHETAILRSSVHRIIHRDLQLKFFKRCRFHLLSKVNLISRLNRWWPTLPSAINLVRPTFQMIVLCMCVCLCVMCATVYLLWLFVGWYVCCTFYYRINYCYIMGDQRMMSFGFPGSPPPFFWQIKYEDDDNDCQVLGSQVSVILATYVTAVLRHWANAYVWAVGWPMSF